MLICLLNNRLGMTRTKFDWNKHAGYKLGSELKGTVQRFKVTPIFINFLI